MEEIVKSTSAIGTNAAAAMAVAASTHQLSTTGAVTEANPQSCFSGGEEKIISMGDACRAHPMFPHLTPTQPAGRSGTSRGFNGIFLGATTLLGFATSGCENFSSTDAIGMSIFALFCLGFIGTMYRAWKVFSRDWDAASVMLDMPDLLKAGSFEAYRGKDGKISIRVLSPGEPRKIDGNEQFKKLLREDLARELGPPEVMHPENDEDAPEGIVLH